MTDINRQTPSAYSSPIVLNPGFYEETTDRTKLGLIARHPYVSLYLAGFETQEGITAHPGNLDVSFFKNGTEVTPTQLQLLPRQLGQWEIRFPTTGMESGYYTFEAIGTVSGRDQKIEGNFELGYLSRSQYFIQHLRYLLFDFDFTRYHVNIYNETYVWDEGILASALSKTLSFLNGYKNPFSGHGLTLDNIPPELEHLLLDGALSQALRSRQTYEIREAHTTQTPGVNLNYDRTHYGAQADFYNNQLQANIKNSILGHFINTISVGDKVARGRRIRYVENFVLMAMVPFGHNVWVI